MIDKQRIKDATLNMFKINMGLKTKEKALVVTDLLAYEEWIRKKSEKISEAIHRSLLSKAISEIAFECFPECTVNFYAYPSVGQDGKYPGKEVEERMGEADVVIAITTYSLSHTQARAHASNRGARIASMPQAIPEMFYSGGALYANYRKMKKEGEKIANLLTSVGKAMIKTKVGTELTFSLKDRKGRYDSGLFLNEGEWGNLPAGEAYIAPIEGTADGRLVVERGWYPDLVEDIVLHFKEGSVFKIDGGANVREELENLLFSKKDEEPCVSRRNLAELGIGTNPYAKRIDNPLEAEKIKGTIHIGIGDNSHIGGDVSTDLHIDFVLSHPTLQLDNYTVIED